MSRMFAKHVDITLLKSKRDVALPPVSAARTCEFLHQQEDHRAKLPKKLLVKEAALKTYTFQLKDGRDFSQHCDSGENFEFISGAFPCQGRGSMWEYKVKEELRRPIETFLLDYALYNLEMRDNMIAYISRFFHVGRSNFDVIKGQRCGLANCFIPGFTVLGAYGGQIVDQATFESKHMNHCAELDHERKEGCLCRDYVWSLGFLPQSNKKCRELAKSYECFQLLGAHHGNQLQFINSYVNTGENKKLSKHNHNVNAICIAHRGVPLLLYYTCEDVQAGKELCVDYGEVFHRELEVLSKQPQENKSAVRKSARRGESFFVNRQLARDVESETTLQDDPAASRVARRKVPAKAPAVAHQSSMVEESLLLLDVCTKALREELDRLKNCQQEIEERIAFFEEERLKLIGGADAAQQ